MPLASCRATSTAVYTKCCGNKPFCKKREGRVRFHASEFVGAGRENFVSVAPTCPPQPLAAMLCVPQLTVHSLSMVLSQFLSCRTSCRWWGKHGSRPRQWVPTPARRQFHYFASNFPNPVQIASNSGRLHVEPRGEPHKFRPRKKTEIVGIIGNLDCGSKTARSAL